MPGGGMDIMVVGILAVAAIVVVSFILYYIPIRLWIAAISAGAPVGLFDLFGMRLRRVVPAEVVNPLIAAVQAGLNVKVKDLEAHYLARGRVDTVVMALISADKAKIPLTFAHAAAIDLAGRNVFEAVRMSVEPKVIDCPDPRKGRETIDAVAKNGIQLRAKARVTVRTSLDRLIGGATEETIIARVGEGIVTSIGSAETHKAVLENPDMISKRVLEKGLDSGTAFEILSIDIADVDVGDNIGAKLQIDQAEADKQIAQAKAEERRALAVALEQEMKALEQEMRARVVEAEAEVPRAMAEAFRMGNFSVMDYYNMKNVDADTKMRGNIAKGYGEPGSAPKKA